MNGWESGSPERESAARLAKQVGSMAKSRKLSKNRMLVAAP